jgi:hypothetical protein
MAVVTVGVVEARQLVVVQAVLVVVGQTTEVVDLSDMGADWPLMVGYQCGHMNLQVDGDHRDCGS